MEIKITKIQIFLMWPFLSIAFPSKAEGINKKDRPIQDIGIEKIS